MSNIAEVQQMVLDNIEKNLNKDIPVRNNLLLKIKEFKHEDVLSVLGRAGSRLLDLSKQIDVGHPLLHSLADGVLLEGSDLYQMVLEIFEISKSGKMHTSARIIKEHINQSHKDVLRKLVRIPPRLIADDKLRNESRRDKSKKNIDIQKCLKIGENGYFMYPKSFERYVRLSNAYKSELSFNERLSRRLSNMGLVSQKDVIMDESNKIEQEVHDTYHGFVRLRMQDAAMILARSLDHKFNSITHQVLVPKQNFYDVCFWESKKLSDWDLGFDWHYESYFEHSKDEVELQDSYFVYQPRAYPLVRFSAEQTDSVKYMVTILDCHPEMNNKPLFDHLWVVVPGIQYSHQNNAWRAKIDGETKEFFNEWTFYTYLDAYLTDKKVITPIILGENIIEKKCYFIGYWK